MTKTAFIDLLNSLPKGARVCLDRVDTTGEVLLMMHLCDNLSLEEFDELDEWLEEWQATQ